MSATVTIRVYRAGEGWRARSNFGALDLAFIDLGAALDGCIALAEGRRYRIVIEDEVTAVRTARVA